MGIHGFILEALTMDDGGQVTEYSEEEEEDFGDGGGGLHGIIFIISFSLERVHFVVSDRS